MRVTDHSTKEFISVYKKRIFGHEYIVFPKLLELMGVVKGKRILDLGCGVADFSRLLAEKGALVDAVDISGEMIETAKKLNREIKNINYACLDASNLAIFKNKNFDFVVMNMVLINIESKDKIQKIFSEVKRVLKDNGIFIFTALHPSGLMIPNKLTEHQEHLEGFSYFEDASLFKSRVHLLGGGQIDFINIHWTLETYFLLLQRAGLYVQSIIEPQPVKNSPELLKDYKIPKYMFFCCKKLICSQN